MRQGRGKGAGALLIAALAALCNAPLAAADPGRVTVELNKLEQAEDGGCRAFFLFRNEAETAFDGFEMSLAILDTDGVIDRLLTIDAAPVPAGRTTLKLFEIPQTQCGDISEILLHEMTSCRPRNGEEGDCFALLDLVSRSPARLVK